MTQKLQSNNQFKTYFKELSIQINLDGLSFCVFNPVLLCVEAIYNFPINFSYKSKEDIFTDRRVTVIRKWLFGSYGSAQRHRYSLEQLESVVRALDPDGKYKEEIENA